MRSGRRAFCLWGWFCFVLVLAVRGQGEDMETMKRLELFSAMTQGLVEAEALLEVDPTKPMVALTFDDGPGMNTEALLELLTSYGGRATFFMVGSRVRAHPEAVAAVARQGSEIGTHTWSHPDLLTLSRGDVESQMRRSVDALEGASGARVTLMRPPYGRIDAGVRGVLADTGLSGVLWTVDTEDWRTRSANATYDAVMRHVRDGSIVLFHDTEDSTLEAMRRAIPELVRQGYQLVTVSELLRHSGVEPVAGEVYRQVR